MADDDLTLDDGENQKEIMVALKDLLALNAAGNNDNYFANLFAGVLVSNKAFIDALAASMITLYRDSDGKGGIIRSANYNGTVDRNGKVTKYGDKGWAVDYDGTADFANMNATGGTFTDITANGGTFNGIVNATDGIFSGSIDSGPLFLSRENSGEVTITLSKGQSLESLYNMFHNNGFINGSYICTGKYGNTEISYITINCSVSANSNIDYTSRA